jgi:hypothetical protein
MNHKISSRALLLFTLVAACGGKFPIGYDHPGDGGATTTSTGSAGSSSSGAAGSGATTTTGSGGAGGSAEDACRATPARSVGYVTHEEFDTLLIRRWQRCLAPQLAGEDVGVEFTADGHYYPLARDIAGTVVRLDDEAHTGRWTFYAVGEMDPFFHQPTTMPEILLTGVLTTAPSFTEGPMQMGILFSPVPSRYVPLDR